MNIIIFAGGAGTRLWPLSRLNSPKQFNPIKDGKSTLQMAVERVEGFGLDKIFISTNAAYDRLVKEQVPVVNSKNIFLEPERRDLAAAVGLTLVRMKLRGLSGTVAVVWSDHFMDRPEKFKEVLQQADVLVQERCDRIIFIGETPRFANHNLGWIHIGNNLGENKYEFLGWKYRPELPLCEKMFASDVWMWNPGYFVFDLDFMLSLYQRLLPDMYNKLMEMGDDEEKINKMYSELEALHFDNAIIEKIAPEQAIVLKVNMGWSDPGTLYALKEALQSSASANVEKGLTVSHNSTDSFLYNEDEKKLLTVVGMEGVVVVNTKDAILVCHKNAVPQIKELLGKLKEKGLESYL